MPNYNHLVLLDLEIYEIYRTGYDPVRNVKDFLELYSLSMIHEYIVALQTYVSNEEKVNLQLSEFSVYLLRVLIAYFIIHTSEHDLCKVSISVDPKQ
ncbi:MULTISPECIES: hypothetical protein [Sphingobacterium]|uniref:hypothetical protein n=1 Tax=Sphingobacterium TaxID=28453 RepID=UPI0025800218|nr:MULTISPECIES: hypothetical protein [Sphingobacterium]